MKNTYYVSWRTWLEAEISTPFAWYPMSRGTVYRKREHSTSKLVVDNQLITSAFEAGNSALLEEIERDFIDDAELLAFVEADSEDDAHEIVRKYFSDAEFTRTQQIDQATKNQILRMIDEAVMKKADT
jgi:hypothetical protein